MKKLPRIISVFLLILVLVQPIIFAVSADNGSTIVYVTNTGYAYHRNGCSYLKSKNSITLMEATRQGYKPCSRCDPPIFNGILPTETEPPKETSSIGTGGSGTTSWEEYKKKRGLSAEAASTDSGKTNSTKTTAPPLTTTPTTVVPKIEENDATNWEEWIVLGVFVVPIIVAFIASIILEVIRKKKEKKKKYEQSREKFITSLQALSDKAEKLYKNRGIILSMLRSENHQLGKEINAVIREHGASIVDNKIIVHNKAAFAAKVLRLPKSPCYHTSFCPSIRDKQKNCETIDILAGQRPFGLRPCKNCKPQYVCAWALNVPSKIDQFEDNKTKIEALEKEHIALWLKAMVSYAKSIPPKSMSKREAKKYITNRAKKRPLIMFHPKSGQKPTPISRARDLANWSNEKQLLSAVMEADKETRRRNRMRNNIHPLTEWVAKTKHKKERNAKK